mmetsp:Transcript_16775/g.21544  ORF Transcript_16775/g.21544 Transcript_16775/m.21544 type:complete len:706 (-) Transcript_16775:362-2479(-)
MRQHHLVTLLVSLFSNEIQSYILQRPTINVRNVLQSPSISRRAVDQNRQEDEITSFEHTQLKPESLGVIPTQAIEIDVQGALADMEDVVTDFLNQDRPSGSNSSVVSDVLEISKEVVQEYETLQISKEEVAQLEQVANAAAEERLINSMAEIQATETKEMDVEKEEADAIGECLIFTEHNPTAGACIGAEEIETTEIGMAMKQEAEMKEQAIASADVVNNLYQGPTDEKVSVEDMEQIQEEKGVTTVYKTPSTKELLLFTIPTLAMWLAGPVMSMVDTSVVGRHNSIQLAALGPATHVCDSALYMFSFLGCATSNFVAGAIASEDQKELQQAVSHSLAMAVGAGILMTALIQMFGPWLLAAAAGPKAAEVVPSALVFTRTRIWGAMAVLVSIVGQAASLGMKDSVTPLRVVALSAFINLFGDIFLVMKAGKGIWGAALATAGAEIIGATAMLYTIKKKLGERLYPFLKFPPMAEFKQFFSLAGPLFASLVGKTVIYTLTTMAVSTSGTFTLAAHQVLIRVFFFFTTFGDALAQTIQSYLPFYTFKAKTDPTAKVAEKGLVKRMIGISAIAGTLNAILATLIPLKLHSFFTTDPLVIAQLKPLAPIAGITLVTHAVVMSLEGIIISKRDVKFLTGSYLFTTTVMVGLLSMIKVLPFFAKNIAQSAWFGLLVFQLLRLTLYSLRVLHLKEKQDSPSKASALLQASSV